MFMVKQRVTRLLFSVLWSISPALAKGLLAKLFFRPPPYPLSTRQRNFLDTMTPFHLTVHGNTIRCWKWGDGPAILFVHGWNGRAGHFSRFFTSFAEAGYSVIALDAPAHGRSEGQTTNYFQYTDTLRAFVDPARGLPIVGMVGHSIGASAAINCIVKENPGLDAVLIAPALRLREILFNLFNLHGIPATIYRSAVSDLEAHFRLRSESGQPGQADSSNPIIAAYRPRQGRQHDPVQRLSVPVRNVSQRDTARDEGTRSQEDTGRS